MLGHWFREGHLVIWGKKWKDSMWRWASGGIFWLMYHYCCSASINLVNMLHKCVHKYILIYWETLPNKKISQTLSSRILNFSEKRKTNHLTKPRQTWLAGPLEMCNSSASVEGSTSGAQVKSAVWQTGEWAKWKETAGKRRPIHYGLSLKPQVTTLKVHVLHSTYKVPSSSRDSPACPPLWAELRKQ